MNYGKAGWPQNTFPGVCVWTEGENRWTRVSGNVQCEANFNLYSKTEEYEKFNTLYFEYDFKANQKVTCLCYLGLFCLQSSIRIHRPAAVA